jgi:hypothetical protein
MTPIFRVTYLLQFYMESMKFQQKCCTFHIFDSVWKPLGAGAGELERLPRGTTNVSANSTAGDPKDGATSGTPSVAPVSSTLDSNASSASSAHAAAANTSDVITWPSPECAAICNGDHSFPECSGGK